jgi:hypothetical protein
MPPYSVRVSYIVDLKPERVLQVVARLFRGQTRHHRSAVGDAHDLQAPRLRQPLRYLVKPIR